MAVRPRSRMKSIQASLLVICGVLLADAGLADDTRLQGVIVNGGVTCPLIRTSSGQTMSLEGLPSALNAPGTRVRLTGQMVQYSRCMQGEGTFRVTAASAIRS
jgi:hypothetical protein